MKSSTSRNSQRRRGRGIVLPVVTVLTILIQAITYQIEKQQNDLGDKSTDAIYVAIQGLKFTMEAAHYSETTGLVRESSRLVHIPNAKENKHIDREINRIQSEMFGGALSFPDGIKQLTERYTVLASEQVDRYNNFGVEIRRLRKKGERTYLVRASLFIIQLALLCYLIWKGSYPPTPESLS